MKLQRGFTLIGLMLTVVALITIGLIALKVIPVYIQNYQVKSSLASLTTILTSEFPEDPEEIASFLRKRLDNQLYIEGVQLSNPQIIIKPITDNKVVMNVDYSVVTPLIANINLLFNFSESQEVVTSAQSS